MTYRFSFETEEQREKLINELLAEGKILTEEHRIQEGNFLIFIDKPLETSRIEGLEAQNALMKAQIQASSDRADFQDDLIAEIAMIVYQ